MIHFKYTYLPNILFFHIVWIDYNKTSEVVMNGQLGFIDSKITFPPTFEIEMHPQLGHLSTMSQVNEWVIFILSGT